MFDLVNEGRAALSHFNEVDSFLLSEQQRQLHQVFAEPSHREGIRSERIDDELQYFLGLIHGLPPFAF